MCCAQRKGKENLYSYYEINENKLKKKPTPE